MDTNPALHLVMLGAAPETRGSISTVVDAYRAHGLFQRWPIEYIATHGEGTLAQRATLFFKALRQFGAALARERRMAVHVHAEARFFWRDAVFIAAAIGARCPVVVQLHGGGFEQFYDDTDPALRAVIRFLLERTGCVAAPSESLCNWLRGVTHRRAHVVCLPHPVACDAPSPESRQNIVLFLGRMEAGKGIFDLLQAVAALRADVPDVRLVCAGDGDRISVARYAERLGIADAVKFTGWVGPSGKRALMESASVFAMPSYDAALPISVVEAMSAGVPVVATAVGGIPEVVVDGVSGFLVAPGDSVTLSRLLRKLMLDRSLAGRIGAAGRESARLRFAPERALPPLESLYAAMGVARMQEAQPAPDLPDLRKAA